MTDQELQKTITDIQSALANRWWQNILLVLAGVVPSAIVAWINHRWNKSIFKLNKEKEENVLKSKLFGEIRLTEGQLRPLSHKAIISISLMIYYQYRHHLCPPYKKKEEEIELLKYQRENKQDSELFQPKKFEFIRLISEYNYFQKDSQLEKLLAEFESQVLTGLLEIENKSYEELSNNNGVADVLIKTTQFYNVYRSKIEAVVHHIMTTTN